METERTEAASGREWWVMMQALLRSLEVSSKVTLKLPHSVSVDGEELNYLVMN